MFFALFREGQRSQDPERLLCLNSTFVACAQSLKKLRPILLVGQNSVPQKNLANLGETSIFTLRDLDQGPLQLH